MSTIKAVLGEGSALYVWDDSTPVTGLRLNDIESTLAYHGPKNEVVFRPDHEDQYVVTDPTGHVPMFVRALPDQVVSFDGVQWMRVEVRNVKIEKVNGRQLCAVPGSYVGSMRNTFTRAANVLVRFQ